MKIRLDSYDYLSLNKILRFFVLNILCESAFQIESNYYPQIHVNECEYECDYYFLCIKISSFSFHQLHKASFIH